MSEITNIKQSILSDITGKEYINRRNFLESPIMWWENEQTQLNATNLNKMSRAIKNVQDEFSTESNNIQSILADVVSNSAGWSSTENNTAEIFNDYENNKAIADYSSAKGTYTVAGKVYQHADGHTETSGKASSVEGIGTVSTSNYQHVQGTWNLLDERTDGAKVIAGDQYAHIVGNGTSENNRSNAHTVTWSGDGWFARHLTADGNATFGTKSSNNKHTFIGRTCVDGSLRVHNNLRIDKDSKLIGKLEVTGSTSLGSTLSVAGLTTLTDANISGKTTSETLEVSDKTILRGLTTLNDTLLVDASSKFTNNVTFNGADKQIIINPTLTVNGDATFKDIETGSLDVTDGTNLSTTTISDTLTVTKYIISNSDVKVEKNNISISLEDEHDHLNYTNLDAGKDSEGNNRPQTVPNAIINLKENLIGRTALDTDFPNEMKEVNLENETIYGAAQYSINLVKSLLNAYILDNNKDDPEAPKAIDKLIEIAEWIDKDEDGVADILSDIESLQKGKLDISTFDEIKKQVTEGAVKWNTAVTQSHVHNNATELASITSTLISSWNIASEQSHTHNNKDLLNGISKERVDKWDASAELLKDVSQDAIDGVIADGARITENTNRLNQQDITISSMQQSIESIEDNVNSNTTSITALNSRITTLENIINTLISSGTDDPTLAGNDPGTTYFIKYEQEV